MNKNHKIEIRISKEEKEQLIRDANVHGFKSISQYVRYCLQENKLIQAKILSELRKIKLKL